MSAGFGSVTVGVVGVVSTGSDGPPEPEPEPPAGSVVDGGVLAAHRGLHRPLDVLLRARVVADVTRQRLDRVVVAVERVGAVDAAVGVPVVDHALPARGARGGRSGQRESEEPEDDHGGDARDAPVKLSPAGCAHKLAFRDVRSA